MEELGNKILEKVKEKDYIKRYIMLSISLFIAAINYNLFVLPAGLVTGGTTGIATITKYAFDLDPSLVVFLLYFIILIIGFIYLGKEDVTAALFIAIVHPLFIKATEGITEIFLFDRSSILLIALVAGLISGVSNGLIYKTELNTGGIGVLAKIIGNKSKGSITKINFIMNAVIVIIGGFIFGVNMVMYACIVLYITKIISEKILLGNSKNKMFYIISSKYKEIEIFIMEELKHDVTIFDVKGKFTDKKMKNIMVVIPTNEYVLVKEKIKSIDKKAFVIITDNYEVKGQDIKINSVNPEKKGLFARLFSK